MLSSQELYEVGMIVTAFTNRDSEMQDLEFAEVMKIVRDKGQVKAKDRTSNKGQAKTQYWL